MVLKNLYDLTDKSIQDAIQYLVDSKGYKIVVVFDLKNQMVVGVYNVLQILVPNQQDRKTFFIKGKLINIVDLALNKDKDIFNIKQEESYSNFLFSENLFGFVGFGIVNY